MLLDTYKDLVSIYNKSHTDHIRTVNMNGAKTLHPTLGEHYEAFQDMVDTFWEDIIVKSLNKPLPSVSKCLKDSTIVEEDYDNVDDILNDLYKDYEYLAKTLEKDADIELNLLVQNKLIDMWDRLTKMCSDLSREMCEEKDEPKQIQKEDKTVKLWLKPF